MHYKQKNFVNELKTFTATKLIFCSICLIYMLLYLAKNNILPPIKRWLDIGLALIGKAFSTTQSLQEYCTSFLSFFAIFLQLIIVMSISGCLFLIVEQICPEALELLSRDFYNGNLISIGVTIFIMSLIVIFFALLFNSIMDLLCCALNKAEYFRTFLLMQEQWHNIIKDIITLLTFYVAINSFYTNQINYIFLTYSFFLFLCMIITKAYKKYYIAENFIARIYDTTSYEAKEI